MKCIHKLDAAKVIYTTCVDEALRNLIPLSTDTSDVVADAAIGMCAVKRNEMVTSLTCFAMTYDKADAVVSQLDRQLRSSALGKVAAARAAVRQRELMQQQAPRSVPQQQPVAPNSKHDI
jgi:alpha-D-ribose 1-methylphosphonate 5-phosphate C-P lyase